jgi:hypothetical protein
MPSDLHRKIEAVHRMCTILSRRPVTDEFVAGMVESLSGVTAEQVEIAATFSIRNEVTLPTPSQILERLESGYYSEVTIVPVKLDDAERIQTWWNDDKNDCGITDEAQYRLHIERWEREHPGESYFETIVKRGYQV